MWKGHLRTFKQIPRDHQSDEYRFKWLKSILNIKLNEKEYSEFFKFLTEIVKIHPETLDLVIERIRAEWQNGSSVLLFKSTGSFLGRLKKSLRRQEFKGKLSRLWSIIFNFPAQDRLKLHLVREYRRELPFGWLYEFVLNDSFFYIENLNSEVMETGAMAVVDILMELLDKSRGEQELMDELRFSGLLEKIGSLWKSPALSKIIKLLAMASSISINNIFDSLPSFMEALIEHGECGCDCVWRVRLVDSILRKYSKRQYVLSQSRAELNSISKQIIKITSKSIDNYSESAEMNKSICGLVKSVLERWEGMACSIESEMEFCEKVGEFLEISYKNDPNDVNAEFSYNLLNVFAKNFIDPLIPQITFFFRNSLKLTIKTWKSYKNAFSALNIITKILVNDGGTDRDFPLLFKEYPSLIEDVHKILSIKGNEMNRLFWLLTLAESPRTKKVLIDFLIDPKQINEIESNEFWINFMGRLTANGSNCFDEVNQWSNGQLLDQFLPRAKQLGKNMPDENFFKLLKHFLEESAHCETSNDPPPIDMVLFLLISCKTNIEMFNWLIGKINCKTIILNNLKDLIPFENEEIAKKVYEVVKNDLMSIDEIINFLFQSKDEEMLKRSVTQWNLLIESGNLISFVTGDDGDYDGDDHQYVQTEAYGNYLEKLFEGIQKNTNTKIQLIKESNDPIEMFLEYHKFGQVRSMKILQNLLLSKFKCSELLLRIPLVVLGASGPYFGGIILDSLILNGWDDKDEGIVMSSSCTENDFDLLKMYYKNRINK